MLHRSASGMTLPPEPGSGTEAHGVLGPDHRAATFLRAVSSQLARAIDVDPEGDPQLVESLPGRVVAILLAVEEDRPAAALELLAADPVLLSTFFQNIDLLYETAYSFADAVGMLTLEAIHHAVEAEEG